MGKVLLVEDSLVDRKKLTQCLEGSGLIVSCVVSGEEAEIKLKSQKPDLIVLDAILPGLSGFELCRKIKADPATKSIPVLICSSKDKDLDKTWGKMSGADGYITKPIDENSLLTEISQLMKH